MLRRPIAFAMLVAAFFVALGGAIALGNGSLLLGVAGAVAATCLAVGGWMLWDRVPTRAR